MLIYVKTNLFDSPAQVLVNTVNTVGVMGKGIALEFKKLYPDMFQQYRKFCEAGQLTIGKLWIYRTSHKWILNFPTKRSWRNKSQLKDIEAGLKKFRETYRQQGITSIAFPQLGVGNGGLDWQKEVQPLMEKYLRDLPIPVYIHLYNGKQNPPEYQDVNAMKSWLQSAPQTLSINEFRSEFISAQPTSPFLIDDYKVTIKNDEIKDQADSISTVFMVVQQAARQSVVSQADMTDFWSQLRLEGTVMTFDFPAVIQKYHDERLFEKLMTKLPYIETYSVWLNGTKMRSLILKPGELPLQEVAKAEMG